MAERDDNKSKKRKRNSFFSRNNSQSAAAEEEEDETSIPCEVPYVEVHGHKYYSDRFYLNKTATMGSKSASTSATNDTNMDVYQTFYQHCTCGARNPPPLLDVPALVASLDLKAALLATYTLDLAHVQHALPSLLQVPTLILHGQKSLHHKLQTHLQQKLGNNHRDTNCDSDASSSDGEEDDYHEPQQGQAINLEFLDALLANNTFHLNEVLPRWLPRQHFPSSNGTLPPNWRVLQPDLLTKRQHKRGVHHPKYMLLFCQDGSLVVVISTGNLTPQLSTDASWVQRFAPACTKRKVSKAEWRKRRWNQGDFGAVLANFLQCQSIACRHVKHHDTKNEKGNETIGKHDIQMLPEDFLQTYLGMESIAALEDAYDFHKAQVHLIATVPGDFDSRQSCTHLDRHHGDFLYSRQRIADLFDKLSPPRTSLNNAISTNQSKSTPSTAWFPAPLLSRDDRLALQPTSIGAHWNLTNLVHVIRSYLGHDNLHQKQRPGKNGNGDKKGDYDYARSWSDQELLSRLDLVWPSQRLIHLVNQRYRQQLQQQMHETVTAGTATTKAASKTSPRSIVTEATTAKATVATGAAAMPTQDKQKQSIGTKAASSDTETSGGGFLFLSSKTFNTLDLNVLGQMVKYEPSCPQQQPEPHSPHIKSVFRLFGGNVQALRQEYGIGRAEEYLPYFLLTSACLSQGAQGKPLEGFQNQMNGTLAYANFELGVMFCSRLQQKRNNRMYCWKPSQCSCSGPTTRNQSSSGFESDNGKKRTSLIHLPIPFSCRPSRFHVDPEEVDFLEDPYMDEIDSLTKGSGNMRFTPRGKAVSASEKMV